MRILVQLSRIIVGALFIFSGLIKLNDPMGFGFKLEDYFAANLLDLPFLVPIALELAIVICIFEILVGLALLLGLWRKVTLWVLLTMILFFTFLTFYSAYFDKVTDCGCFGDAIPLTPWQSFYKDVVLTVLIFIIFAGRSFVQPLIGRKTGVAALATATLFCALVTYQVLNHLPFMDFRAYKVGTDIPHAMLPAEEIGLEGPEYETFFTLENEAGERIEISGTEYVDDKWYEKPEWKILDDLSTSRKVKEGYEPSIHDLSFETDYGDITDSVLSAPRMILILSYRMSLASPRGLDAIGEWAWEMDEAGWPLLGWSSTDREVMADLQHKHQLPFEIAVGDLTTIKTVVRANPGIVALKNGVVVGKWHWKDRPTADELEALYP